MFSAADEVEHPYDCPFYVFRASSHDEEHGDCQHPNKGFPKECRHGVEQEFPEGCPLLLGPALVMLDPLLLLQPEPKGSLVKLRKKSPE